MTAWRYEITSLLMLKDISLMEMLCSLIKYFSTLKEKSHISA